MKRNVAYENLQKANYQFVEQYQTKFQNVLASGWFILGKEVEKFEQAFASYIGMKHCIGLASGLDALILALQALDLPPKSEVIISANAYVACILSILKADLIPVLVEPECSANLDVNKIEEKITANTSAIMPVHLYGYPCEMEPLLNLANKYRLHIIEDCAQAHGATYFDRKVGTFGTISAFSYYPTKNLGALGDAGAALTNDDSLAMKLRALRNYGSHTKYHNDYIGINSRLDEVQAGFLNVKLPYLDEINDHKRMLGNIYNQCLDERYQKPKHRAGSNSVYHIYNIFHDKRDELRAVLKEHGITTDIHYPIPPYRQKAFKGMFDENAYPISDRLHATTLSLPISYAHSAEDIEYVCEIMNKYIKGNL